MTYCIRVFPINEHGFLIRNPKPFITLAKHIKCPQNVEDKIPATCIKAIITRDKLVALDSMLVVILGLEKNALTYFCVYETKEVGLPLYKYPITISFYTTPQPECCRCNVCAEKLSKKLGGVVLFDGSKNVSCQAALNATSLPWEDYIYPNPSSDMDAQDIDEEPNVHFYPNNAMDKDNNDLEADTDVGDDGKDNNKGGNKDGSDNQDGDNNHCIPFC